MDKPMRTVAQEQATKDAAEWERRTGKPMPDGKYRLVCRAWWQGLLRGDIRPINEIPGLAEKVRK